MEFLPAFTNAKIDKLVLFCLSWLLLLGTYEPAFVTATETRLS